jgi:pimeloyl-ACP methyl ester carboxylesterase
MPAGSESATGHWRGREDVWQWSVETGEVHDNRERQRAFLWIPPGCKFVRGVVFGQQVILEENFLEDPQVREAARRENLALVLQSPFNIGYTIDDATWNKIQKVVTDLAAVSGYEEIERAPILSIGHSGGGIWAWNIAYHSPERSFGIVTIKSACLPPPTYAPKSSVDGVPTLSVSGQYESWGVEKDPSKQKPAEHHWRWLRGDLLSMRGKNLKAFNSELVEPGVGHFGWADDLAGYISMFIEKAAHYRIPAEAPAPGQTVKLKEIPLESGWLQDCTFLTPSRYAPAPYKSYTGDPFLAMWHLDGDLAKANDNYRTRDKGKKLQMVGFVEDDKVLQPAWIQGLKFNPLEDGQTVKVAADFVKETPPELSFPAKQTLGHAPGPIRFRLIGGWSGGNEQLGPDTFRFKMDRMGYVRGFGSLMIMAYHPGNEEYAYCEQAVGISCPGKNDKGTPQTIDFPAIPNQKADAGPIELKATCDTGRAVEYFVLSGPAEVKGKTLKLTAIPPRSKFPVKVTVVACQWGRSVEPLFQSAKPVEQTFEIEK